MKEPALNPIALAATAACFIGGVVLHAGWLPWSLIGVFAATVALRAALGLAGRPRAPWWLRLGLMLGLGWLVIATYGNPFGREAGSAMLLAMLAAKVVETHSRRDARVVLTATCFVAMAAFLFDQGPVKLLLAAVVVVMILSTMRLLAEVTRPEQPNLSLALRSAGLKYLLLAIPFALVCFMLFPRLGAPLWGAPTDAFTGRTGISDRMEPGSLSALALDDTPVMRVSFDGPIPPAAERYFRGLVLWWFDGRAWAGTDLLSGFNQPPVIEGQTAPIRYEVMLEPTDQRWLFMLDAPGAAPADTRLTGDFQVRRESPVSNVLRYEANAWTRYRMQPELPRLQRRLALGLGDERNPRTRALAQSWAEQTGGDARAIAQKGLELINQDFIYSFEPPLLARDSIDDFLFSTRAGFCEHFASAYAFLMRAAGVPSRVVVGFQGGLINRAGNYLIIRRADAHAWTEVWFEGEGWVRIDPTAAVAPERISEDARTQFDLLERDGEASWLTGLRERTDLFGHWWNRAVVEFNALRQRQMLQALGAPPDARWLVVLLVIAAFASLALALFWLGRTRRHQDPVLRQWLRFKARLQGAGIKISPATAPQALIQRALHGFPDQADAIRRIGALFIESRYATGTLVCARDARGAASTMRQTLRGFKPRGLPASSG